MWMYVWLEAALACRFFTDVVDTNASNKKTACLEQKDAALKEVFSQWRFFWLLCVGCSCVCVCVCLCGGGRGGGCFVCCFLSELPREDTFEKKLPQILRLLLFFSWKHSFQIFQRRKKGIDHQGKETLVLSPGCIRTPRQCLCNSEHWLSIHPFFLFPPKYFKSYHHPSRDDTNNEVSSAALIAPLFYPSTRPTRISEEQTSPVWLALVVEVLSIFPIFYAHPPYIHCKFTRSCSGFNLLDAYLVQI